MDERPGPQYNRGNDPTTGVCILKNATPKKWYLRFWNIFSLFFVDEQSLLLSSVAYLGEGGGGVPCPLSLRPKRGPKAEKNFFLRPGPPLSQNLDDPPPPYLKVWIRHWSYWVGRRNGGSVWIASNLYSRSLELANIPFLKPEKCTPFGRSFGV